MEKKTISYHLLESIKIIKEDVKNKIIEIDSDELDDLMYKVASAEVMAELLQKYE